MSTNVLSRISKGQLRGFEEALEAAKADIEESWKSEEHRAAVARDLHYVIRQALQVPKTLRDLWNSTFDQLLAHQVEDYNETGHELLGAFEPGLKVVARVVELVEAFERLGGRVEGAEDVRAANEEVQRLKKEALDGWPFFTEQDAKEALAEYQRGEYLEITDAFAQMAGVDRETFLKRVEERKRTWRPQL